MSKLKTGDVLSCEVCGLSVIVDEECGCAVVDVMCCDEPMVYKGPAAPKKKAAVKKVKPAAKKKVVKKAPKKAVKKPVVKKKSVKKATKK